MKKLLLLCGTSRTGKTTICSILHKEYGYNIIKVDAVINAIKTVSDLKIDKNDIDNDKNALIIQSLIKNIWVDINFRNYKYILETCSISAQKAFELQNNLPNYDISVLFLVDNSSASELYKKIVATQKAFDWTSKKSKEELLDECKRLCNTSNILKIQCQRYNIPYVDVKNKTVEEIKKIIISFLEE